MERKNNARKTAGGKTRGPSEKVKKEGSPIGLLLASSPSQSCNDKKCPFHGHLKVRGRIFTGKILTRDTHKTAVVGWQRLIKIRKYERYAKRKTKIKVHNPECINANIGDKVTIAECRPLSKTKSFVIIKRVE